MRALKVMVVAGEASGDALAAGLVTSLPPALRRWFMRGKGAGRPYDGSLEPEFFGAGGPRMAAAGVELAFDLTAHAVVGVAEVLKRIVSFRRMFLELLELAKRRQPDVIVLVDYAGFNRRFAAAVKGWVRSRRGVFHNWQPRIVYLVSPQVWASRSGRAYQLARDVDLMLSIFPFEKEWYAQRVPAFRVEYIGHPLVERSGRLKLRGSKDSSGEVMVLLLPGSRRQEVRRHLPVLVEAGRAVRVKRDLKLRVILPGSELVDLAKETVPRHSDLEFTVGNLRESLPKSELALACSGTVTMECALAGVPAVVIYRVSLPTYAIARLLARVQYLAMPNLLAGEEVYPELIQGMAVPERVSAEALDLLTNEERRERIQARLREVVAALGAPGALERAAEHVAQLLFERS